MDVAWWSMCLWFRIIHNCLSPLVLSLTYTCISCLNGCWPPMNLCNFLETQCSRYGLKQIGYRSRTCNGIWGDWPVEWQILFTVYRLQLHVGKRISVMVNLWENESNFNWGWTAITAITKQFYWLADTAFLSQQYSLATLQLENNLLQKMRIRTQRWPWMAASL